MEEPIPAIAALKDPNPTVNIEEADGRK